MSIESFLTFKEVFKEKELIFISESDSWLSEISRKCSWCRVIFLIKLRCLRNYRLDLAHLNVNQNVFFGVFFLEFFFVPCLTVVIVPSIPNVPKNLIQLDIQDHFALLLLASLRKESMKILTLVQVLSIYFALVSIQASQLWLCKFSKTCTRLFSFSVVNLIFLGNCRVAFFLQIIKGKRSDSSKTCSW